MVDIAPNAHTALEGDAAVKRQQAPSPASFSLSADAVPKPAAEPETPDAVSAASASSDVRLEISQIESSNGFVYKLVNTKTGDIIRQWPTEQMLKMREYIAEHQIRLVDETA